MNSNEFIPHEFNQQQFELLITAFNNRTRELNYYILYSRLLDGFVTEKEFNDEIEKNPDKYAVGSPKPRTEDEIMYAALIGQNLMGVDETGEFQALFEIDDESLIKFMNE